MIIGEKIDEIEKRNNKVNEKERNVLVMQHILS
jgi:hypothetical protein